MRVEGNARPVALVTGASRGIGREAAVALAGRGFDVVVAARTFAEGDGRQLPSNTADASANGSVAVPGSLATTIADISAAGGEGHAVMLDLLDRVSVEAAADSALAWRGRLDAVVLAGIYQGPGNMDRIADLSLDDVETIVRADYLHQLLLLQLLVPAMCATGGGAVVNVTSFSARHDPPGPIGAGGWGLAYAAAKAAMHRVAGHLHVEFGPRGLRAYNLDPGHVVTAMARARGAGATLHGTDPALPGAVAAWLCTDDDETRSLAGATVIADKQRSRFGSHSL